MSCVPRTLARVVPVWATVFAVVAFALLVVSLTAGTGRGLERVFVIPFAAVFPGFGAALWLNRKHMDQFGGRGSRDAQGWRPWAAGPRWFRILVVVTVVVAAVCIVVSIATPPGYDAVVDGHYTWGGTPVSFTVFDTRLRNHTRGFAAVALLFHLYTISAVRDGPWRHPEPHE